MARNPLPLGVAFVSGLLVGVLAMAGLGPATGPDTVPTPDAPLSSASTSPTPEDGAPDVPAAAEVAYELSTRVPEVSPAAIGPKSESEDRDLKVRELTAAWARMQEELTRLQGRIAGLEQRLAASVPADTPKRPARPATEDERRSLLVKAGVADDLAADILWRESQYELDRLELRDLAMREGWFGSERYRDEVGQVEGQKPKLRGEIGDDAYDRYLFAAGEDNRVRVGSVIPGSSAEEAGLVAGDLIETYDGGHVFTFSGLREATAEGERGELVPVDVRRSDGSRVQTWLPRGPLGVRMDLTRADPDA